MRHLKLSPPMRARLNRLTSPLLMAALFFLLSVLFLQFFAFANHSGVDFPPALKFYYSSLASHHSFWNKIGGTEVGLASKPMALAWSFTLEKLQVLAKVFQANSISFHQMQSIAATLSVVSILFWVLMFYKIVGPVGGSILGLVVFGSPLWLHYAITIQPDFFVGLLVALYVYSYHRWLRQLSMNSSTWPEVALIFITQSLLMFFHPFFFPLTLLTSAVVALGDRWALYQGEWVVRPSQQPLWLKKTLFLNLACLVLLFFPSALAWEHFKLQNLVSFVGLLVDFWGLALLVVWAIGTLVFLYFFKQHRACHNHLALFFVALASMLVSMLVISQSQTLIEHGVVVFGPLWLTVALLPLISYITKETDWKKTLLMAMVLGAMFVPLKQSYLERALQRHLPLYASSQSGLNETFWNFFSEAHFDCTQIVSCPIIMGHLETKPLPRSLQLRRYPLTGAFLSLQTGLPAKIVECPWSNTQTYRTILKKYLHIRSTRTCAILKQKSDDMTPAFSLLMLKNIQLGLTKTQKKAYQSQFPRKGSIVPACLPSEEKNKYDCALADRVYYQEVVAPIEENET